MKKLIRLLGTALLVAGMGIGGTALTAGAASADTGTQAANLQVSGGSWHDRDNCRHWDNWNNDGRHWNDDKCRDDHGRNGDHRDRNGDHRDRNGDHRDHNGDGNRRHC